MNLHRTFMIVASGLLCVAAGFYFWQRASQPSSSASAPQPRVIGQQPLGGVTPPHQSTNADATAHAQPPRIVALSPAIGIILRDLERVSSVVGRHGFDSFLPSQIPTCGDQAGIDFERLLTVSPTHILTQWGTRELPERLRTLSQEKGWITSDYPLQSLADIRAALLDIDRLSSPHDHAQDPKKMSPQAAKLVEQMDQAWAARSDLVKERVMLLGSIKPYGAFGPGSCHHDILLAIGAVPALTQGSLYVTLDAERIIEIAPDVIIYLDPLVGTGPPRIEPMQLSIGQRPFRGRAMALLDAESQIPSTSMIRLAHLLAQALAQPQVDQPKSGL